MTKNQYITDNIDQWIHQGFIANHEFNTQYRAFCKKYSVKYQPAPKIFETLIQAHAKKRGFNTYLSYKWIGMVRTSGRFFTKKSQPQHVRNTIASNLF